ncbi:hypothetical protein GWK48_08170 [Metallosphaera tengchongensis]|uniref:Uncharacterized protein n=1 Tax=Metallosphaera tengchongensis TaxID=1532350 RepID=A0A6N0NWV3_9CREN|nr:hypothetical protein [Metallosphaera tengchongensis]QKR00353.1 hypothetical protein GWK48_08170 [Metallosphaera tengchongensis]
MGEAFHRKARNMLEDSARKVYRWVVDVANSIYVSAIFSEDFNDMVKDVKKLSKEFRDNLYLVQYPMSGTGLRGKLESMV